MKYTSYLKVAMVFLWLITVKGFAQQNLGKHSTRYYSKHPVWIEMMNDANANYYETIKAFKAYWKNRELPKEAFESGTDNFEKEMGLEENEKEEKEVKRRSEKGVSYAAEVRAFKGWIQSNQAWVKADGYIMTSQERQDLITRQQQELKGIELKNGKK